MFKIIFFTIFIIIFVGMNIYTYKRFLSKLSFLKAYKKAIQYFLYLLTFVILLFFSSKQYDIYNQKVLWVFSYAIGILFMLFVVALLYDLLHTASAQVAYDKSRRKFLKIAFDVTFLILAISYLFKGMINGLKEPILRRVPVKIKNLKSNGFKIIQLSDVHVGNVIKREFVQALVQRVNDLKPDLVVITGDLIDSEIEKIKEDLEPLKNLRSKYGTYFVLGNHEYFFDPIKIIKHLKTLDITILENESVLIEDRFNLVGVTDFIGTRMRILEPDLPKAFKDIEKNLPTIALAHQPKMVKELERYKPDLIISGHTHGGQIFPFGLLVLLDQPYLSGLYQHNEDTQIFVSNGTGFWGPAIRLLADSEISEIELGSAYKSDFNI